MTTEPINIDPKIANHVDAALAAGFTVYATPHKPSAGWVALCLEEDGPWAHIQVPTMSLDPVQLDVPINPNRAYGSGVLVDHDGTPEDAVRALRKACTEPNVTVRFMTRHYINEHGVPVVPNYGRKCITGWPNAVQLGERGSNWQVRQRATRLEVGDRFIFDEEMGGDGDVVTVESRQYAGPGYTTTIVTATDGRTITLPERTIVTLAGAS